MELDEIGERDRLRLVGIAAIFGLLPVLWTRS
jgi:hypothetical protein